MYNITRIVEFTQFARERGLSIQWQSLYQPECLDPARLGDRVLAMARAEIEKLLSLNICLDNERTFFENVLQSLSPRDLQLAEFKQHIANIEEMYHKDKQGQFAKLWPELEFLCK